MFTRRSMLKLAGGAAAPLFLQLKVNAQESFVASMQITDIGLPENATEVQPVEINTDGNVLVNAIVDDSPATFIYRGDSFVRVGGTSTATFGLVMSDAGSIAGSALNNDVEKAALIGQDNVVFMPGEFQSGRASALSNEGVVAGAAIIDAADAETRPVYWTESTIKSLPAISGGTAGGVLDLNTILQKVGWSDAGGETLARHATLWENDAPTDLGTLGGNYSEARAINETGLIVGASMTSPDQNALEESGTAAFSWQDGKVTDLGLGADHTWGIANDVNDVGMIVGLAGLSEPGSAGNETVAILWSIGEVIDLNTITTGGDGLTLVDAVSVNSFGQILCKAVDTEGNTRIATLSVIGN